MYLSYGLCSKIGTIAGVVYRVFSNDKDAEQYVYDKDADDTHYDIDGNETYDENYYTVSGVGTIEMLDNETEQDYIKMFKERYKGWVYRE